MRGGELPRVQEQGPGYGLGRERVFDPVSHQFLDQGERVQPLAIDGSVLAEVCERYQGVLRE